MRIGLFVKVFLKQALFWRNFCASSSAGFWECQKVGWPFDLHLHIKATNTGDRRENLTPASVGSVLGYYLCKQPMQQQSLRHITIYTEIIQDADWNWCNSMFFRENCPPPQLFFWDFINVHHEAGIIVKMVIGGPPYNKGRLRHDPHRKLLYMTGWLIEVTFPPKN